MTLILGVETTCDETAASVVQDGRKLLSNVIFSQTEIHERFGGVVPELASRTHIEWVLPVIDQALRDAACSPERLNALAVAQGPGLIGPLLVGINTVKGLALAWKVPWLGVNHIEAHLYAASMCSDTEVQFPALGVVVSGGHTSLFLMENIGQYQLLSNTVDDALGEAFDKAAKLLALPYPGGPHIEQLARQGDPLRYPFQAGQVKGFPLHFSFSGLKTALFYALQKERALHDPVPLQVQSDLAASFQRAAFSDLVRKVLLAAEMHHVGSLLFGGGVTNNNALRAMFQRAAPSGQLLWPPPALTLDNAAMIAGLAYHRMQDPHVRWGAITDRPYTRN